ncbi:MAG: cation:proton antiporter, partial [Clostridia bacterium]|nr:cation:proton antiporter [Clostridia bacterium]
YGVILTAPSVSVTVAPLKEMGKLNTKAGTSIISAAILDDIIGIIVLSVIIGMKDTGGATEILRVLLMTFLFFVAAIGVGILVRRFFKWLDKKWPHNRRVPIFSLAICFFFAYAAEHWFGVADITGSFIAGLVLSSFHSTSYIDRKIDINCYMVFGPVFFANIGINTSFSGLSMTMLWFGLAYIAVAIISKLFGCGAGALLCRYSMKDSMRIGLGMMVRAEVVLVCTQKGIESGMVDSTIMPFVLMIILITSFATPILMKMTYRNELNMPSAGGGAAPESTTGTPVDSCAHSENCCD